MQALACISLVGVELSGGKLAREMAAGPEFYPD